MGKKKEAEIVYKRKKKLSHWIPFYLMGLPGTIYLLINNYLPMTGLQIAFKKFNYSKGVWGSEWTGFDNFKFLFGSNQAARILRNTIGYNLVFIVLGMVLGVAVAIFVNEIVRASTKKFYQTIIMLPHLISMVVVAYLVYAYFSPTNGLINAMIQKLGGQPVEWYSNPNYWPFILTFVHIWKGVGFGMVLYLSSIVGINTEYYEAAKIDGATKWQQIKKITIPMLKPMLITMLILNCGMILRSDFGLFFQVPRNQGALFPTTDTIDTFVYRGLMVQPNIAMSSAAGFLQSVVGFVLVVTVNFIVRKMDKESAMF